MNHSLIVALLTLGVVSNAQAQETPLEHFRKDVDVVIRLAEVDRSFGALLDLAEAIQPNSGLALLGQLENIGQLIGNPDLTGVDRTKDWYVGVYCRKSNAPVVVFAIPAKDTEDMLDVMKDRMKTRVHGDYVFYSEQEIPVAAAGNTVVERLSKRIVELADPSHLAIYVNIEHLRSVYADQIEFGRDSMDDFLNQVRQNLPQQQGVNVESVIKMYRTLADVAFQGVDDGTSLTVTLSFDKSGLTIDKYITFEDGSESDKFFTKREPSPLNEIDQLPEGAQVYFGASNVTEMMKYGYDITAELLEDEDAKSRLKAALSGIEEIEISSSATSFRIHNQTAEAIQSFGIVTGEPMTKLKEFTRTMSTEVFNSETSTMKQTAVLNKNAESYADEKADVFVVKHEFPEPLPEENKRVHDAIFGDGMTSRTIYRDDHYLTSMGGGREAVERLLKSVDGGKSNGLAKWREPFPEEANFLGLADLPSLATGVTQVIAQLADVSALQAIDNLDLGVSYSGLSVTVEPEGVLLRTHLPMEQIQGVYHVASFFEMLQRIQQP